MEVKVFNESYESPRVEIIEVEVEKGFATSSSSSIEQLGDELEW